MKYDGTLCKIGIVVDFSNKCIQSTDFHRYVGGIIRIDVFFDDSSAAERDEEKEPDDR